MKILMDMFITFFKIGAFTLGGGYAMLPIIQKEVVEKKKWIGETEFLDMVAISQSAPGPLAVNISAFVGQKMKGLMGLITSTLGAILPSFIIIILVASVFLGIENSPVVQRVFQGIRPAVVALIAVPVISMGKTAKVNKKNFIIPLLAAVLVAVFKITPIYVILGAAAIGVIDVLRRK
ncbi:MULTISPECIES: chromate transporter [Clostridium]|uniref:Chromate transport protein n=1 Tax=Clostridium butyricum E4 str. BoNT E BL5262 TaxID=632245 RepID=C4IJX1_CLOBU|nr:MULTISPECIES: chromate transporter [Clostridium]EDT74531.1 chromate transport protein [Clostridium butyricum 5521]EEP54962.1 chromate transport protein [Clostridium butyricum E4 str. BoNT E BL5262]NFL32054.1 chromate transporter [Clostridium butyricum]NFS17840.1 chromate transporter [Clostridium butyricum]UZT05637.1 chromate transporter [Clostridium sp. LQ25]